MTTSPHPPLIHPLQSAAPAPAASIDDDDTSPFTFARALAATRVHLSPQPQTTIHTSRSQDSTPVVSPIERPPQQQYQQQRTDGTSNNVVSPRNTAPSLPPRIPVTLSRMQTYNALSRQLSAGSTSTPQTPTTATMNATATPASSSSPSPRHHQRTLSYTPSTIVGSDASTSLLSDTASSVVTSIPSLADLISPADASFDDAAFFQEVLWNSPTMKPKSRVASPLGMDLRATPEFKLPTLATITTAKEKCDLAKLDPAWRELLSRRDPVESVRADPAVHALIASGVPPEARGELWKILSGSNEERRKHAPDYYVQLLLHHRTHGTPYDDEIRRDIGRALPNIDLFNPKKQPVGEEQEGGTIQTPKFDGVGGLARLNRVLCAFATRNIRVGYCQGANILSASLLTLLDEESAFWILCQLIESRSGYYCKSMCGLEIDQGVLRTLISYYLPKLYDHLTRYDITIPSFTVSWFVCLFAEPFSDVQDIYLIFDYLFLDATHDTFLFRFALTLLKNKQHVIMKKSDTGELMEFLLHSGFRSRNWVKTNGMEMNDSLIDVEKILTETDDPFPSTVYSQQSADFLAPASTLFASPVYSNSTSSSSLHSSPLSSHIISLRTYHKSLVVNKARQLHPHIAQRFADTYKYSSHEEIQKLWEKFLSPDPYGILLHGSLTSLIHLSEVFIPLVFSDAIRKKWRSYGICDGFLRRMWKMIDTEGNGEITFENYLIGIALFTRSHQQNLSQKEQKQHDQSNGKQHNNHNNNSNNNNNHSSYTPLTEEDRYRFAFRFYDVGGDGRIDRREMYEIFRILHCLYNGEGRDEENVGGENNMMDGVRKHDRRRNGRMMRGVEESGDSSGLDTDTESSNSISSLLSNISSATPSSTSIASSSPSSFDIGTDTASVVSNLFVTMIFQKAADFVLASSADTKSPTMNKDTDVVSHSNVVENLYERGLSYGLFRKCISYHPFTQVTFNLTVVQHQHQQSNGSTNGSTASSRRSTLRGSFSHPGLTSTVASVPSSTHVQPRVLNALTAAAGSASSSAATVPNTPASKQHHPILSATTQYSLLSAIDRTSPAISPPLLQSSASDGGPNAASNPGSRRNSLVLSSSSSASGVFFVTPSSSSSSTGLTNITAPTGLMPLAHRPPLGLSFGLNHNRS